MGRLLKEENARPSLLTPILRLTFGLGGAVSALLGKEKALGLTLALQKIVEDNYDESIRILREGGLEEGAYVRKELAALRDAGCHPRVELLGPDVQKLPKAVEEGVEKAFSVLHQANRYL